MVNARWAGLPAVRFAHSISAPLAKTFESKRAVQSCGIAAQVRIPPNLPGVTNCLSRQCNGFHMSDRATILETTITCPLQLFCDQDYADR